MLILCQHEYDFQLQIKRSADGKGKHVLQF